MKEQRETIINKILTALVGKPKTITEVSREIDKEKATISKLLHKEMKQLVEFKEEKGRFGTKRIIKLKKKAYNRLNIPYPTKKKSSHKSLSNGNEKRAKYLNSDELDILNYQEREMTEEW